jgi:hypothetical protein
LLRPSGNVIRTDAWGLHLHGAAHSSADRVRSSRGIVAASLVTQSPILGRRPWAPGSAAPSSAVSTTRAFRRSTPSTASTSTSTRSEEDPRSLPRPPRPRLPRPEATTAARPAAVLLPDPAADPTRRARAAPLRVLLRVQSSDQQPIPIQSGSHGRRELPVAGRRSPVTGPRSPLLHRRPWLTDSGPQVRRQSPLVRERASTCDPM